MARLPFTTDARRAQWKPLLVPIAVGICLVFFLVISGHHLLAGQDVREVEAQFFGLPQQAEKAADKPVVSDDSHKAREGVNFGKQVDKAIQVNRTAEKKLRIEVPKTAVKPKNETAKAAVEPKKNETMKAEEKVATTDEKKETKEKKEDTESATTDATEDKKKKPLNIVLLYADDMRHDSLGIAGTQVVKTPYIDRLAREGIRFTHNCVTTSVCWISRATLYTGQYLSRHETTMPFTETFYKDWNKSWPTLLHKAGYHVGHVGKWHHGDQKPIKPSYDFFKAYYGKHVMEDGTHITKMNERDSLEFLKKRPKDKPFVLSTCFFAPHAWDGNPAVWVPQNSSMKLYQDTNVSLPDSYTEKAWKDMPDFFTDRNEARTRFRQRFQTPEMYQDMIKNYYRLISEGTKKKNDPSV